MSDDLDRAGTLVLPEGMVVEFVDATAAALVIYGEEGFRSMWPDRDPTEQDWRIQVRWATGSSTGAASPHVAILARDAIERGATMYVVS